MLDSKHNLEGLADEALWAMGVDSKEKTILHKRMFVKEKHYLDLVEKLEAEQERLKKINSERWDSLQANITEKQYWRKRIAELEAEVKKLTSTAIGFNSALIEAVERAEKAEADLQEEHEHNERLEKKLTAWGAGCACGYDNEDAVCAVHHPRIQKAEAERDAALDVCRAVVEVKTGLIMEQTIPSFIISQSDWIDLECKAKALLPKPEGSVKE